MSETTKRGADVKVSTPPQTAAQEFDWKLARKWINRILFWIMILVIAFAMLFPFYWAFNTSLKTENQIINDQSRPFPAEPTGQNYEIIFDDADFMRSLFNSALVSSITVLIALVVGSFAAYALGRVRFRGRTIMLYVVLAMTMFPQISILAGLFEIVRELDVFGSTLSLMATYPIFTLPFTVWVLTSFFQGLPREIEQSALVDGATPFQTFYLILLPLTLPALVTTGLLAFIAAWNEYLFALTFTVVDPEAQTVPVAIALFSGTVARQEPVAEIAAATVVVTVPLVILVVIFQRQIIGGLTAGAVKG